MFFTQEDYNKIYNWIKLHSIKDSEFSDAKPLDGREIITIVQQGYNVKFLLKEFLEQLSLLNIPDFINVTERYNLTYISLFEAVKAIPYKLRKIGQVITFLDEDNKWKIYQFRGENRNQWNILTLWVDILQDIIDKGNILPDEEDLTSVTNGDRTVVKFKDKAYNPDNFSGKGRIYLRKNIIQIQDKETLLSKTVNLLTQSMFGQENTIYIVQYDYDLNGQTITIPQNSKLIFIGGSINNGTLNCINTTIQQFNGTANLTGNYKLDNFLYTDDEDITKDIDLTLKFADKEYNPANFSGLGRVYLRKNIVEVEQEDGSIVHKNILTQDMINKENTEYIIQYDYDLNEEEITIPDGCILKFENGSFNNGDLSGGKAYLQANNYCIFNNITIKADTFYVKESYVDWFYTNDLGDAFTKAVNLLPNTYGTVKCSSKTYNCTTPCLVKSSLNCDFNSCKINVYSNIPVIVDLNYNKNTNYSVVYTKIHNVNIHIYAKPNTEYYTIDIANSANCEYKNIIINTSYDNIDSNNDKVGIRIGRKANGYTGTRSCNTINNCFVKTIEIEATANEGTITDCKLWASNYKAALILHTIYNWIIDNNQFVGGSKGAIYIPSTESVYTARITNNYFDGSHYNINTNDGIFTDEGSFLDRCIIATNLFWHQKRRAIYCSARNTIIANNIFDDNDYYNYGLEDININCLNTANIIANNEFIRLQYTDTNNKIYERITEDTDTFKRPFEIVISNLYEDTPTKIINNCTRNKNAYNFAIFNSEFRRSLISYENDNIEEVGHYGNTQEEDLSHKYGYLYYNLNLNIPTFKGATQYITAEGYSVNLNRGDTSQRPKSINDGGNLQNYDYGFKYFDTDINKIIFWNGNRWVFANGFSVTNIKGKTSERPISFINGGDLLLNDIGFMYFDDDIYKPIFLKEIKGNGDVIWTDANGFNADYNKIGTTEIRPILASNDKGFEYFDTTINKPIWWNGTEWVDSEGNNADSIPITSGTFANKPTGVDIGYAYFCTDRQTTEGSTNGIMIYYKGSNTWVDTLGRTIS